MREDVKDDNDVGNGGIGNQSSELKYGDDASRWFEGC